MLSLRLSLVLSLIVATTGVHGFYSQNNKGEKLIEAHESSFAAKSQVELYDTISISPEGSVETGQLLLIYSYGQEVTYGIVHFVQPEKLRGFTVLSIQQLGQLPEIYMSIPGQEKADQLGKSDWKDHFFDTPWQYEDILDDDHENWVYHNKGIVQVDGILANMIESSYSEGELKDRSAYNKREVYLARDDNRFLKTVFYGRDGEPMKCFEGSLHHDFGTPDEPRVRCTRLVVTDYRSGAVLILTLRKSIYDINLPKSFFDLEALPKWSEKNAPQAIAMAQGG